jgi:hypothetical protein
MSAVDGKRTIVQGNAAVSIDRAIQPQTEDVLDGTCKAV